LPGASLGDYCVLGAGSVLNKSYQEQYVLYGGSPAKPLKSLSNQSQYFLRTTGFID